jgi:hypothetical protein
MDLKFVITKLTKPLNPGSRYTLLAITLVLFGLNLYNMFSARPAERHHWYGNCAFYVWLFLAYQVRLPVLLTLLIRISFWAIVIFLAFHFAYS